MHKVMSDSDPFEIDEKVQVVCAFLKKYYAGNLDSSQISMLVERPKEDECKKILDRLWGDIKAQKILNVKFNQRAYILHLYERCALLQKFYDGDNQLKRAGHATLSAQDSKFYQNVFEHFRREVAFFCNGELSGDWAKTNEGFLAIKNDGLTANLLHLSYKTQEAARKATKLKVAILDLDTAVNEPGRLSSDLAPALEVPPGMMENIFQRGTGYVLTPDFALKLFVLNERRKVRVPTLFSGDTGVGKTEILRVFAEILNSKSDALPDFFLELMNLVFHQILNLGKPTEQRPQYKAIIDEKPNETYSAPGTNKLEFLIGLLRRVFDLSGTDRFRVTFDSINFVKGLLSKYPLLTVPPPLRKQIDECSKLIMEYEKVGHLPEMDDTFPSVLLPDTVINKVICPVIALTPHDLFHKILMSESYSAESFKAEIRRIDALAKDVGTKVKGAISANVVVFIDELNTSKVLGVVKEVMVDRTVDGEEISKNLFFIGAINPDTDKRDFVVHTLPPSMDVLILQFSTLSTSQEEIFLRLFLRGKFGSLEKTQVSSRPLLFLLSVLILFLPN